MKPTPKHSLRIFLFLLVMIPAASGCSQDQETANLQVEAIDAIRIRLELPALPLVLIGMTSMANSPSGNLEVACYQDTGGRKYYIEPISNQVVEIDARSVLPYVPMETSIMPAEILAKANRYIRATIPGFDLLQAEWTYEQGSKADNYFFAWIGKMEPGFFNPPFAQIAIHKSGILFAYINTLLLYP